MGKKRVLKSSAEVSGEHPDGGTFYFNRFDIGKLRKLAKIFNVTEFAIGPSGEMLYNQKTGEPVVTSDQDIEKLVDFIADELFTRYEDVEDEAGNPVPSSADVFRGMLQEITENAQSSMINWSLKTAGLRAAAQKREAEIKNS